MLSDQVIADNHALIARNRELECELAALKAKLGAVERIADGLRGEARMAVVRVGDGPMPRPVAARTATLFHVASELREALR